MDNIYSKKNQDFKVLKTKPETIDFLLAYSKSLNITHAEGFQFESCMN